MNVTHLLNSTPGEKKLGEGVETTTNPGADHCTSSEGSLFSRAGGTRLPCRSRTPWSAGGFSLPLMVDTKSIHSSTTIPASFGESPIEDVTPVSPKSLEHKFSDSGSSQSSYAASSSSSSPHSRMSSLSTVNGSQRLMNSSLDFQPMETLMSAEPEVKDMRFGDETQPPPLTPVQLGHKHSASSGQFQAPGPDHADQNPEDAGATQKDNDRPASPSDVTLIKRSRPSISISPPDAEPGHVPYSQPTSSITRTHKRASSAPDFAAINASAFSAANSASEPLPPVPRLGEPQWDSLPSAGAADHGLPDPDAPLACMHMDNCDTGSQPRKAISHLFGRNKLCTRLIPDYVWVHFCRKHYQRDRYRNGPNYARTQCGLVLTQIRRVQAWSDQNKQNNRAGILQDWSLALRKREQKRIEERSKKRRYGAEDEEDSPDRATLTGTAVPEWLLEKVGDGYTTAEMGAIIERVTSEVVAGSLEAIPDIEILPNISTGKDTADEAKAKLGVRKRACGPSAHKRSQSVGVVALPPVAYPMARRTSHPNAGYRGHDASDSSPTEKRQRIGGLYDGYPERGMISSLPLRNLNRTVPTIDHLPQPSQRRPFPHIPEHRAEDGVYGEQSPQGTTGHYEYQNAPPTLPSQRPGIGQIMGPRLDPNPNPAGYQDHRRPAHQRSHSDASAFHQSSWNGFRSMSSTGFSPVPSTPLTTPRYEVAPMESPSSGYGRQGPTYEFVPPSSTRYYDEQPPSQQSYRPGPYSYEGFAASRGRSSSTGPRHARHQSTPVVPRSMQMFRNNSPPVGSGAGHQDQPPYGHLRHQSYASAHSGLTRTIQETDHAPEEYSHDDYTRHEYDTRH